MSEHYVYTYAYPPEMGGAIFYVGKGQGDRVDWHEKEARQHNTSYNSYKLKAIRAIHEAGYRPVKAIVFQTTNKQEALEHERELIKLHSATLTNIQHNTKVNPFPCSHRDSAPTPTREQRQAIAIERALLLNSQVASERYGEDEREEILKVWNQQSIQRIRRTCA